MVEATLSRPHVYFNGCVSAAFESPDSIRFVVARIGTAAILHAAGEIDALNSTTWRCLLTEVADSLASPGTLILDLSDLTFIGARGFAALATTSRRCRERGITVCLVGNDTWLTRIVAACRWQDDLPVFGDVSAALDSRPTAR